MPDQSEPEAPEAQRNPDVPVQRTNSSRQPDPWIARKPALNIYLCGMIGSGKTAIGERLAARLGRPFYDLDQKMDLELGYSFHRLVREQGWLVFRELEYDLCRRFAKMQAVVVALGGGTVRYAWNTDVLRGTGITILLESNLAVLAERVRRADRPRVHQEVSLEGDLDRVWTTAGHLYRQAADMIYRTDAGKSIDEEVADLCRICDMAGPAKMSQP